ncbi:hypothetical protein MBLNU13_g02969t1 [Cladosporium sp. NU13]
MAQQPFPGSQGFGQRLGQGDSSNAGGGQAQGPHTGGLPLSENLPAQMLPGNFGQGLQPGASGHSPTHVAPGRFGQGLRPGGSSQHGSRLPGELPAALGSGTSHGRLSVGGPSRDLGYMGASFRRGGHTSNRTPSSRALGLEELSDMGRSLDSIVKMRANSHRGGHTSNQMPSSTVSRYVLAPTHRGGRLQEQKSPPRSIGQGYNRDYDANKRKRLGENLEEVTFMGPWMRAFKKRQISSASEEPIAAINSAQLPDKDTGQGEVVIPEVDVPIPANSTGLSDVPATAPIPMPATESVVEEFVPCPESQSQTSIELASITATPHCDTSMVNASDVDTPDQASEVDVILETPSTPEHRCSLQWDCESNECVQR